ncbi:unnamed protein product [Peniophora sp. CBMAI 1063]|nr:unnamed protein product [Peniophora sp. CBMAI 1063]
MSDSENTAISQQEDEVEVVKEPVKAARPKRASAAKKRKADESDEEDAYEDAFEDEEDAPAPKKKAKTTPAKKAAGKGATQTTLTAKSKNADPFSITLEGDDDETVPLLDSCDELRKKINVHLDVSG